MNEVKCTICEADFRAEAIVYSPAGVPKCGSCATAYPNARTKEEVQVKPKDRANTLSESRVRELVYEILDEANIKRVKCEQCSKMFFKRGPMQVLCPGCKAKKDAAKKESK